MLQEFWGSVGAGAFDRLVDTYFEEMRIGTSGGVLTQQPSMDVMSSPYGSPWRARGLGAHGCLRDIGVVIGGYGSSQAGD